MFHFCPVKHYENHSAHVENGIMPIKDVSGYTWNDGWYLFNLKYNLK